MLVKGAFLLLAFMGVLAIFGRLRYPGRDRLARARCPQCGRLVLSRRGCRCSGKG